MNDVSAESTDSPPPADLTGYRMGDMQVLARLGRGGMADVYKGLQLSLDRQVAVKVLRHDLASDASYVERFRREARAAAKLAHPHIVQVYEVGQWKGMHYICQEFVDGMNLRELLDRDGPIDSEMALEILFSVAAALDHASAAGITHRDIKPENLMLGRRGEVKVADFGLARVEKASFQSNLTQAGLTMGTPLYMSPEQVQGGSVDVRSDLYSLGVTMYHLLTGHPPFDGDTPLSIAIKHVNEKPEPLATARATAVGSGDTPPWLPPVIDRLMQKSVDHRYQSPAELIENLHHRTGRTLALSGMSRSIAPSSAAQQLQELMHREPRDWSRFIAGSLLVTLLIGAALVGAWAALTSTDTLIEDRLADLQTVSKQESVEQQFLLAQQLQTPEAWSSVWQYFPANESEINEVYEWKSRLQLGRYYLGRGNPAKAITTVEGVLDAVKASDNYRLLAASIIYAAHQETQQPEQAQVAWDRVLSLSSQLSDRDLEVVMDLMPDATRERLVPLRQSRS